jgi:hypothetical protein
MIIKRTKSAKLIDKVEKLRVASERRLAREKEEKELKAIFKKLFGIGEGEGPEEDIALIAGANVLLIEKGRTSYLDRAVLAKILGTSDFTQFEGESEYATVTVKSRSEHDPATTGSVNEKRKKAA